MPAVAAVGLLATVIVAGVALGGGDDPASPSSAEDAGLESDGTVGVGPRDRDGRDVDTGRQDPTRPHVDPRVAGDDVAQVQQRLTDLGFWPGPVDGVYGDETIKSVWAYEKLVLGTPSDSPSGEVTPEMWDAMQDPFVSRLGGPIPRRPTSRSTCPSRWWRSSRTTSQ